MKREYAIEDLQEAFLEWLTRWALDPSRDEHVSARPALVEVGEYWMPYRVMFEQLQHDGDLVPLAGVALVHAVLNDARPLAPMTYAEAVRALS